MVPVLLEIGPLRIYSFGVLLALAFLVAGFVVATELRRKGEDPELAWTMLFWAAVGGLAGSRLLSISYDLDGFLADPVRFLVSGAGFVFYGGLLGGILTVSILLVRRGVRWRVGADCVAPGLALGHAVGRVGCQVSGDGDWGVPTSLPWGMSYPRAVIGWEEWTLASGLSRSVRVHPAPVYESVAYLLIFAVLWSLRPRSLPAGTSFWIYLVLGGIARFAIEFVRVEPVVAAGLTQAQWIAILLVVIGSLALVRARNREVVVS